MKRKLDIIYDGGIDVDLEHGLKEALELKGFDFEERSYRKGLTYTVMNFVRREK